MGVPVAITCRRRASLRAGWLQLVCIVLLLPRAGGAQVPADTSWGSPMVVPPEDPWEGLVPPQGPRYVRAYLSLKVDTTDAFAFARTQLDIEAATRAVGGRPLAGWLYEGQDMGMTYDYREYCVAPDSLLALRRQLRRRLPRADSLRIDTMQANYVPPGTAVVPQPCGGRSLVKFDLRRPARREPLPAFTESWWHHWKYQLEMGTGLYATILFMLAVYIGSAAGHFAGETGAVVVMIVLVLALLAIHVWLLLLVVVRIARLLQWVMSRIRR